MTLDLMIIIHSVSSFLLFVGIQIIFFRMIDQKKVIRWLVVVFGIVSLVSFLLWLSIVPLLLQTAGDMGFLGQFLASFLLSYMLFSITSLVYVLGFFGIIESSIRIRLLDLITYSSDTGISLPQILQLYNRDVILQKRLSRFISSGELIFTNDTYRLGKRSIFFFLPALVFKLLWVLYRGRSHRKD